MLQYATPSRFQLSVLIAALIAGIAMFAAAPSYAAATKADAELSEAADHGGDYAHGAEETSLLSFDVGSYIWKLIIFGVFFILLAKFVWPPILKGLQEREQKQRRDLQSAEDAAKNAAKTLAEYKQQLADAQEEAQRIVNESRAAAQQVAAKVKSDAEAEIVQLRERTTKEIAAAKESALADIYEQAAVLSTQVAGQILKRELNPQDQQGLVTESLQQIQGSNN